MPPPGWTPGDTPLTTESLRRELRRHRWAQWRGAWAIIVALAILGAALMTAATT